jgi:hypothetical protein
MVRLRLALCLAALFALAALPAVEAQAGVNDPKVTVSLEVTPKSPTIALGGAQAFKVNVIVHTTNIFCTSQATMAVKLELKDSGLTGISANFPASVDVPIKANVQPPVAKADSDGNNTARLDVAVASSTMPDHTHSFTVTATTPTTVPVGCSAASAAQPPASTASAEVTLKTGPAPVQTGTSGVTVSAGSCSASVSAPGVSVAAGASCPSSKASFFVPIQIQVAALLGVGLLRRRFA